MPAIGQRSSGLAFEIQNHEVGFHPKHLAKMVIAVNSDALRSDAIQRERPQVIQNKATAAKDASRKLDYSIGKLG